MPIQGKPLLIDTRPTKELVVDSLTRDISVEACIFDLIDNSIDAARDATFAESEIEFTETLPDSYAGFEIKLRFSDELFSITDNCGGIKVDDLETMVLRFGQRSSHPMGMGIFGLGLNRALFKLGRISHLDTDTGSQRAKLTLKTVEYLKSDDWRLPAEELPSRGKAGTTIKIVKLYEDISHNFSDVDWVDKYRGEIGRRYGRFINKGLTIKINGKEISDGEVQIRKEGPFPGDSKKYKIGGVSVRVRFGQHNEHRFSAEPDYDKARNTTLTDQFGWTVICNDRAIIVSDKTMKTGWETKFHTEFYGFVGIVTFDALDPFELPWDTTKFDVDMNSSVYQTALIDMRKFAEKWRSYANQAKVVQRRGESLLPIPAPSEKQPIHPPINSSKPHSATDKKSTKDGFGVPKTKKPPTSKSDHNQFKTVLPDDVDELHCFDKHLALVHEAKRIDLSQLTYSGLALIRSLFEVTVVTFHERHGKLEELKQYTIGERSKGGTPVKNEKDVVPNLEEMISFMLNNPGLWGAVKQNHLKHSLSKISAHKKILNSALHNPWQAINQSKAFEIRDEALPILRHLIEN